MKSEMMFWSFIEMSFIMRNDGNVYFAITYIMTALMSSFHLDSHPDDC